LREGDVALTDVFAPYDFTYKGDIDEDKMRRCWGGRNKKTPASFEIDEAFNFNAKKEFNGFLTRSATRKVAEMDEKAKLDDLKKLLEKSLRRFP